MTEPNHNIVFQIEQVSSEKGALEVINLTRRRLDANLKDIFKP